MPPLENEAADDEPVSSDSRRVRYDTMATVIEVDDDGEYRRVGICLFFGSF